MKIRGNQKGQSSVEFALSVLIFFAFLFVMADMVRICYSWVSLQYAVNDAARFGSLIGGSDREAQIEARVLDVAQEMGVTNVSVSFVDDLGGGTAGRPLTFYRLIAETPVDLTPLSDLLMHFTGDYSGQYNVNVNMVTRNEPFA